MIRALWLAVMAVVFIGIGYLIGLIEVQPSAIATTKAPTTTRMNDQTSTGSTSDDLKVQKILASQLATEQQRLQDLTAALDQVTQVPVQPPTGSIDTHIGNLNQEIADLQRNLQSLNSDQQNNTTDAQVFQQIIAAQSNEQQLGIQTLVTEVSRRIDDLQNSDEPPPNEIDRLNARRELLRSELNQQKAEEAQLSSQVAAQRTIDQEQVRTERTEIQRRLNDLRADLSYWQAQRTAGAEGTSLQTQRSLDLQRQIQEQQSRVDNLRNQLQQLSM